MYLLYKCHKRQKENFTEKKKMLQNIDSLNYTIVYTQNVLLMKDGFSCVFSHTEFENQC